MLRPCYRIGASLSVEHMSLAPYVGLQRFPLFEVTKSLWMRGTLPGTGNEFCFPDSVTSRPVLPAHSHPRKLRCGFGLPGRDLFSVLPWLSRHPFLRLKELSDAENRSNSSAPSTGFPSQGSPTSNLARFPTEHLLLQLLYIGPMNDEELQLAPGRKCSWENNAGRCLHRHSVRSHYAPCFMF